MKDKKEMVVEVYESLLKLETDIKHGEIALEKTDRLMAIQDIKVRALANA